VVGFLQRKMIFLGLVFVIFYGSVLKRRASSSSNRPGRPDSAEMREIKMPSGLRGIM